MAPPPPPPPPPPPLCLPFGNKKAKRRLSFSSTSPTPMFSSPQEKIVRHHSSSSTMSPSGRDRDSITFHSDSELYDDVPALPGKGEPKLLRSNTMSGTRKSSGKWGFGSGKAKERELSPDLDDHKAPYSVQLHDGGLVRRDTTSTQASRLTTDTAKTQSSSQTRTSSQTKETYRSNSTRSSAPKPRPPLIGRLGPQNSSDTLVGSAYERKVTDNEPLRPRPDTTDRLEELRKYMAKEGLEYYVVPSEDAHGSEYVAASDKRREFISGFSGSVGHAIVGRKSAHLFVDSRYWLQAEAELDPNWRLVRTGANDEPADWIEWLVPRAKNIKVGIDARMISHEKATLLNSKLAPLGSKLISPPQNLVDLVWKEKPGKPLEQIYLHPDIFTGEHARHKIAKVREWIKQQPAATPSYSKAEPTPSHMHVATLVTSLSSIAYTLNLRGSDIPYNPLFHAYLFIGLDRAILFVEPSKLEVEVIEYLRSIHVDTKSYTDLWPFLRRREWGEGKVLISPQTPYAISLMLTHFRYTIAPSPIDEMLSIKNEVELDGMKRAYFRDGVSFVRFLAWLEDKLQGGYDITEYEAAFRLTEFRRKNKNFMGLAYENISASGPNAALPHYSPKKQTAAMISRDTPYLNDSGAQYLDGTCDTTRTMHFGRPTPEMCDAYTRVLQGHIAIDTAIFPEGTSGRQLDVLARKALWKEGYNYMHGTGHGFGSFLSVHEGAHGFSSNVPLMPNMVITNEPGFYLEGKWGMRIESALYVKKVTKTARGGSNGDVWLGFERLTHVPIQTRMVKESMLTKEEKQWIKDHNQRCYDKLAPYLKDDKRALKWLEREAKRGIGIAAPVAGLVGVEWD